ncbi:unnamed protein product [Eruca vesicaria subsp. sativa]|uniref:DNA-directed RNA polymerase n=1 Tax=Eruca vesicaria subsp. sativa TaxID=29727 RepID=A0ABC8L451_ERUVS|nr:unnamed protein product [Eruca vesicaria subsp. sativa]
MNMRILAGEEGGGDEEDNMALYPRKEPEMFTNKQASCGDLTPEEFKERQTISECIFIKHGLQNVFESSGEMPVEPSFNPTNNKDHEWKYAMVKFGEVSVDKPTLYFDDKELEFLSWHVRLQNMTYSVRMKVNVDVEKTGQDEVVEKQILSKKTQDIPIGRIPVMVKFVLCNTTEKGDNGESSKKGESAY